MKRVWLEEDSFLKPPSSSSTSSPSSPLIGLVVGCCGDVLTSVDASVLGAGLLAVTSEVDMLAEHARQLVRFLPGGLTVVGLYHYHHDGRQKTGKSRAMAEPDVDWAPLLHAVHSAVPQNDWLLTIGWVQLGGAVKPRALHFNMNELIALVGMGGAAGGGSSPLDIVLKPRLQATEFSELRALVPVSWLSRIPVPPSTESLKAPLDRLIEQFKGALSGPGVVFSFGSVGVGRDDDDKDPDARYFAADSEANLPLDGTAALKVDVLFPLDSDADSSCCAAGLAFDLGSIESRCFVPRCASVKQAVDTLKADVLYSLRVRVGDLIDELQLAEDETRSRSQQAGQALAPAGCNPFARSERFLKFIQRPFAQQWTLPARRFFQVGTFIGCDYIYPGESEDDSKARIVDVLDEFSDVHFLPTLERFLPRQPFPSLMMAAATTGAKEEVVVASQQQEHAKEAPVKVHLSSFRLFIAISVFIALIAIYLGQTLLQ